jgi:hypothetical protein
VGERPGFTLSQDGDVVSIIGWKGLKGKLLKFKINAEGKAVNRTPYAADMTLYRPNKSAQGPAEVFRIVLSLEANKLVYEDSFQYNVPVAGHPVGTETRIQRYERIPPN